MAKISDPSLRYFTGKPCVNGHISERYIKNGTCCSCMNVRSKSYHVLNKDEAKIKRAIHYQDNKDRIKEYVSKYWRKKNGLPDPSCPRTELCECCGKPPGQKALALDHCHQTGKFRGWLCKDCNTGLGSLGDNIDGLERAIAYLRRVS